MTGKSENKFGIPISLAEEVYNKTLEFQNISIVGVDVHIGSQITNLKPFEIAFEKIAGLIIRLRSSGQNISRANRITGLKLNPSVLLQTRTASPSAAGLAGR